MSILGGPSPFLIASLRDLQLQCQLRIKAEKLGELTSSYLDSEKYY